jgi:general secretion pathway protein I
MKKGFTLIEVLVAMSILAVSLVVILQLFSGGLKSSRLSDRYSRGVCYAREKMDEILLAETLSEGAVDGESADGFRWRSESLRLDVPGAAELPLPFLAYNIKVEVRWNEGQKEKRFAVSTVKLVPASGGGG